MSFERSLPTVWIDVAEVRAGRRLVHCRSSTGEECATEVGSDLPEISLRHLIRSPLESSELIELGRALFHGLLAGTTERVFRAALAASERGGPGGATARLRLELAFTTEALAARPWELLYDPVRERFLAADGRVSLARRPIVHEPTRPLVDRPPLRILAVFPRGTGLHESANERTALETLASSRRLELRCLDESVTLEAVQRAVGESRPHIVHVSGHGSYGERPVLGLEGVATRTAEIDAMSFARSLTHTGERPTAAVISACEGGHADTDSVRSVASALLRHGIQAVVAMQTEIPDRHAAAFCGALYDALAASPRGDLEAAVSSARARLLSAEGAHPSFASPVLFVRGGAIELWSGASAERHLALRLLEQRRYARALETLDAIDAAGWATPEDRYLMALAALAGRRPRELSLSEADEIEKHLEAATETTAGDRACLALALVKHDVYRLNGLRDRPPTVATLLDRVDFDRLDKQELERLLEHLPIGSGNPVHARAVAELERRGTAARRASEEPS